MEAMEGKNLRLQAKEALKGDNSIRKLILLSSGVVVVYNILLLVLNLVLDKAMVGTGGLAGMQTRAMLDTVRYLFQEIGVVLLPFWQMGVLRVALCRFRGQETPKKTLLFGFSRFGPLLGYWLILGFALIAVLMTCINVASVIFAFTPMGQDASVFLASYMSEGLDYAALLEQVPMDQLLAKFAPAYILAAVIGIPAVYLVWCKFRMAQYAILEDEKIRAFPAILKSVFMSAKQFWSFLWLDLGFWWYYLLVALMAALGFADVLLPALGVQADPTVLGYVGLGLNYAGSLLVAYFLQPRIELTYVAAYETLRQNAEERMKEIKESQE